MATEIVPPILSFVTAKSAIFPVVTAKSSILAVLIAKSAILSVVIAEEAILPEVTAKASIFSVFTDAFFKLAVTVFNNDFSPPTISKSFDVKSSPAIALPVKFE